MAKLKVAEIFYSLQGEGLFLGTPSIFLRLFGCNFTCSGFGMPRGELSEERLTVDPKEKIQVVSDAKIISTSVVDSGVETSYEGKLTEELKYKKYEDLPLVHTGCDSYASWDPRFKHLSPMLTLEEICDRIESLLPNKKFDLNTHLIITGGEPLLPGWQKVIPELIEMLRERLNLENVTFETNGTQPLIPVLTNYLLGGPVDTTFSISSKMPVSGHTFDETLKPDVIRNYYWAGRTYFKWVVASEEDMIDVQEAIQVYKDGGVDVDDIPIYLMPVGGTADGYYLNNKQVAELAMKNGWRYSPRLQVELWRNAWGT